MKTKGPIAFIITLLILILPWENYAYGKESFHIAIAAFPSALNPVLATEEISQGILNKIFESLYHYNIDGEISPFLVAQEWESEDGQTIILEISKNHFFNNGDELDADDVIATFELLRNPGVGFPYPSTLAFISYMQKTGEREITLKLHHYQANWRHRLTFKILNAREIKKIDIKNIQSRHYFPFHGSGPYQLKAIDFPNTITLTLNPFHHQGKGNDEESNPFNSQEFLQTAYRGALWCMGLASMRKELIFRVVGYPTLFPLKLLNQEIDICELQPECAESYDQVKSWQKRFDLVPYRKMGYTYLVFNLKNAGLTLNVRRLIYNALIMDGFLQIFLKGRGEVVTSPFFQVHPPLPSTPLPTTPLATPIHIKIMANGESILRKQLVMFLRQRLLPLNIHLEPVFVDYHTLLAFLHEGSFDVAVSGFLMSNSNDVSDIFMSDSGFNYARFNLPQMDTLLKTAEQERIQEKRIAIYKQAHTVWQEHLPLIPLFNLYYYLGISKDIQRPPETYKIINSSGDFLYDIDQWSWK